MKTQQDYIDGLVMTRQACDKYAANLTTYSGTTLETERLAVEMDAPEPTTSYLRQLTNYMGITEPQVLKAEAHETEAPTVFSYSLYYVYYDQYTYINGVLFQNIIVAIGAIIIAMQVLTGLRIALIIALCVFFTFF